MSPVLNRQCLGLVEGVDGEGERNAESSKRWPISVANNNNEVECLSFRSEETL